MTDAASRTGSGAPLFEARGLSVGHGKRAVVEGIDVTLRPGEALGVVGPNGSGKTTFLRTVLGLLRPLAGSVWRDPSFRAAGVPQADAIDPVFPFPAIDVVLMAARADAALPLTAGAARERDAREALERVGIGSLARRAYTDLSGGQRQRVLLARALAARPTVLALDEPTTGLDLAGETALLGLLRTLREEEGMAVVLVSHGLATVANEATQVLLLHEGRHREGPVDSVLVPEVLGALYGIEVRVDTVAGRRLVSGIPARSP